MAELRYASACRRDRVLAVDTLTKAFDVPRTNCLVYRAFSRDGAEILLPDLGVDHRQAAAPPPALAERVGAAMRSYLGADEPPPPRSVLRPGRRCRRGPFTEPLASRGPCSVERYYLTIYPGKVTAVVN